MTDSLVTPVTPGTPKARRRNRWSIGALVALVAFVSIAAIAVSVPVLPLRDPLTLDLAAALQGPSSQYVLGTDQLGRDLLSRLLWGTRTSLLAGAVAIVVAAAVGVPTGLLAAYRPGIVDSVLSRSADIVLTLPGLVLLLAVKAALNPGIIGSMAVLGLLLAPTIFRVIRAATLRIAQAPYVQSGRLSGASHWRILWRYLLPNVREQVAVQLSFLLGFALLVEAGISFLGVGVELPSPSLGNLLLDGANMMAVDPRILLVPGFVLTTLILACNVIGDALA